MPITALPRIAGVLLAVLLPLTAGAQSLSGTVLSAGSRQPIPDVVVTVSPLSLMQEQVVVTDARGQYQVAWLTPGVYTVRFEREGFKPYVRTDVIKRKGFRLRVDVSLAAEAEEDLITLSCGGPIVDVGSSSISGRVPSELAPRLAMNGPGLVASADSLVAWVPGAAARREVFSLHGSTPYENAYLVDGLSTGDAASGLNALPLSLELLSDVEVYTGGYLPEHGRASGGILPVVTRYGSNELHGSVFAHWTPGVLEGRPEPVPGGQRVLENRGDFGLTLGGPILKDRLWFFVGAVPSLGREAHTGGADASLTDQRSLQALGKLTYLINSDHNVSLSVLTAPSGSRTAGASVEPWERDTRTTRVMVHHFGAFLDKRMLLDVRAGWLTGRVSQRGEADAEGPERTTERYQANARLTWFLNGLGNHVFKAGVDTERLVYEPEGLEPGISSTVLGGYVQDSWSLASRVTVNGGVRYDVQSIEGGGGRITVPLLAPRVGLVVDPWADGRTRLFAHHAQYMGVVPPGQLEGAMSPEGSGTIDPDLGPLRSRELLLGVERELVGLNRVGAAYTRRTLDPGLTSGLPGAGTERTYDAVTLSLNRDLLLDGWLGHLSYTASRLRGNASGFEGAPAAHVFRAYGARELRVTRNLTLTPALAYLGSSGIPGARAAWSHSVDVHLDTAWKPDRESVVSFTLDAFNVFNFQAATRREEQGTALVPVRYQPPRQVRFGVRYLF